MSSLTIGFSLAEKLAVVQALDAVILADGKVHKGEIDALRHLMQQIDFDSDFILQARNLPQGQAVLILDAMPLSKKKVLAKILEKVAISDGFIHKKETAIMGNIFSFIGLLPVQE